MIQLTTVSCFLLFNRPVSCKPPRKIDFGNYTHPRADFLTQDATDEREWDIAGSFFPNAGLKFDHSTTDGNGNLIYFNGKWMGSGPYVGDRVGHFRHIWYLTLIDCLFLHLRMN